MIMVLLCGPPPPSCCFFFLGELFGPHVRWAQQFPVRIPALNSPKEEGQGKLTKELLQRRDGQGINLKFPGTFVFVSV